MSVISGVAGAQATTSAANTSADAISEAAQISADALLNMFNQQMVLQAPYHQAGVNALTQLTGVDPTGSDLEQIGGTTPAGGALSQAGGGGVDPTGGASQYMQALQGLDLDLPDFQYSFNPDDPAYQFKLEESQKAIDRASAARGNYNSRAAINEISQSARAITADEATKQYQRQKDTYGMNIANLMEEYKSDYGQQFDLYNMAMKKGATEYGGLMDLINIGAGSAGASGQSATATGQGLASTYSGMGSSLADIYMAQGQSLSNLYSGIGQSGINAYMMYMMGKN
jgi:hypothetical protein